MNRNTLLVVAIAFLSGILIGVSVRSFASPAVANHEAAKAYISGRYDECLAMLRFASSPHDLLLRAAVKRAIASHRLAVHGNEVPPPPLITECLKMLESSIEDLSKIRISFDSTNADKRDAEQLSLLIVSQQTSLAQLKR